MSDGHTKEYNIAIQRLQMPSRMLKLPVDERGYPVPKFVQWIKGKPDFRVLNRTFMVNAVRLKLCWLCGEQLGRHQCFVIGPMCAINRTSSEPPSHLECAQFAARACPFLTQPNRVRNSHEMPAGHEAPPGFMIPRNPGVTLLWVTQDYKTMKMGKGKMEDGLLFRMGEPTKLEWYSHGRAATREEIMESIESGLPTLREAARIDGPDAMQELDAYIARGIALVPA